MKDNLVLRLSGNRNLILEKYYDARQTPVEMRYGLKPKNNVSCVRHNVAKNSVSNKSNDLPSYIENDDNDVVDENFAFYQSANHTNIHQRISFQINFSDSWPGIQVETRAFENGRERQLMKKGWAHTFAEKVCRSQKLPCPFAFNQNVSRFGEKLKINIKGHFRECDCYIYGESFINLLDLSNITFDFNTLDTKDIPHYGKRFISSTLREQVKETLLHKKVNYVKNQLILEYHEYGDIIGPLIPNDGTLHSIRHQSVYADLNITEKNLRIPSINYIRSPYIILQLEIRVQPFFLVLLE